MGRVSLNKLTSKDLIDHAALSEAFKTYLIKILKFDEYRADFVVSNEFENPYNAPFVVQNYEGSYTVDGKWYEVRSCHTDFCYCGLFHLANKKPFKFYMFFDRETLPDNTVGSYQKAKKLYLI